MFFLQSCRENPMHRKKQIPRGEGKSQMKTKEWSVRGYKPKAKASEAVFFLLESLNHVLCKTKSTIVLLSFSSSRIILGRKKNKNLFFLFSVRIFWRRRSMSQIPRTKSHVTDFARPKASKLNQEKKNLLQQQQQQQLQQQKILYSI
jgi:hypothetical protein